MHTTLKRGIAIGLMLTAVGAASCGGAGRDSAEGAEPDPQALVPPVGVVQTLAGPIDAGSGGLEVDEEGNVYTADFGATLSRGPVGTRIHRVSPDGAVRVFAEGLQGASGNTIGPDGRFYQANIGANSISVVEPEGTLSTFVDEGLTNPVGIAFGPDGDLMVANCGAGTIGRVDGDGNVETFASSQHLRCPNGLILGPDGDFYVSNFSDGAVVRITPEGEAHVFARIPGDNNGHLIYGNGVFYVAARSAHQIVQLDRDGTPTVLAGSGGHGIDDGPALEATLSFPNDLALSPDGRILYWNDVAEIVEDGGQVLAPVVIRMLRLR